MPAASQYFFTSRRGSYGPGAAAPARCRPASSAGTRVPPCRPRCPRARGRAHRPRGVELVLPARFSVTWSSSSRVRPMSGEVARVAPLVVDRLKSTVSCSGILFRDVHPNLDEIGFGRGSPVEPCSPCRYSSQKYYSRLTGGENLLRAFSLHGLHIKRLGRTTVEALANLFPQLLPANLLQLVPFFEESKCLAHDLAGREVGAPIPPCCATSSSFVCQ